MKTPFFIIGSPRSGTTLLRDLLRMHPRLACPEETHIFRWADPFASTGYSHSEYELETLQLHRSMDQVSESEFDAIYKQSNNRKEFLLNYFIAFADKQEKPNIRVFDKTPQHAYGLLLLHSYFPDAKFIHLVRNPKNVISSLILGHQIGKQTLTGAINFWQEPVSMVQAFLRLRPDLVKEVRYEDLIEKPNQELKGILEFVDEVTDHTDFQPSHIHMERNLYQSTLTDSDLKTIQNQLAPLLLRYNY